LAFYTAKCNNVQALLAQAQAQGILWHTVSTKTRNTEIQHFKVKLTEKMISVLFKKIRINTSNITLIDLH